MTVAALNSSARNRSGAGDDSPSLAPALLPETWVELRRLQMLGDFGDDRFDKVSELQCDYCRRRLEHSPSVHADEVDRERADAVARFPLLAVQVAEAAALDVKWMSIANNCGLPTVLYASFPDGTSGVAVLKRGMLLSDVGRRAQLLRADWVAGAGS